jgi:hypothetical protein
MFPRHLIAAAALTFAPLPLAAEVTGEAFAYTVDGMEFEGYVASACAAVVAPVPPRAIERVVLRTVVRSLTKLVRSAASALSPSTGVEPAGAEYTPEPERGMGHSWS